MYKVFWVLQMLLMIGSITDCVKLRKFKPLVLLNEYATRDSFEDVTKPDVKTLDIIDGHRVTTDENQYSPRDEFVKDSYHKDTYNYKNDNEPYVTFLDEEHPPSLPSLVTLGHMPHIHNFVKDDEPPKKKEDDAKSNPVEPFTSDDIFATPYEGGKGKDDIYFS